MVCTTLFGGTNVTVHTELTGYALARWARADMIANPAKWTQQGKRTISPCYTAGYETWLYDDAHVVRFSSVAGHGEQATYDAE